MEFFRAVYDEEEKRTATLQEHSENNVTLVTLYSGFALFVLEKQAADLTIVAFTLFALALCAMALADPQGNPVQLATDALTRRRFVDHARKALSAEIVGC